MKKNVSLFLIVLATVSSVFALAYFMKLESFTFAWALNFLLMMWISTFIEIHRSPLESTYYDEKTWERRGKIYEYLGVNFFRKLLVLIGWEKVIRKSNPIEKMSLSLQNGSLSEGLK